PHGRRGHVLVRTAASLISAGTERMAIEENRKGLLEKARTRPDLVKQIVRRTLDEGFKSAYQAVHDKLDSRVALGYSAAGVVAAVGEGVTNLGVGDRVACAGTNYATHAEMLSVPRNLCVRLPDAVDFEAGAFGALGAIALQGVRLAELTLGESVAVIGLGLLGQLTVQLLRANGCRVFGLDLDESKIALAKLHGAEDGSVPDGEARRRVLEWSRGRGADAVLVTAATESNQPIELAGEISRLKGRIVAVGLVGMDVPRAVYFERELSLKVSMSYGPGRYDPVYEERGHDYPFPYVRWTEGRNIEAFLDLVASNSIGVERLVTHRFPIEEGEQAYRLISGETNEPYLGVLLTYLHEGRELERRIVLRPEAEKSGAASGTHSVRLGLIGAGGYARKMLLPHLQEAGVEFQAIATASGVSALEIGEKYKFKYCVSGAEEVLNDPAVNLVVIATRHDSHAHLAQAALEARRHVFVEKPLALSEEELEGVIAAACANPDARLMVGFNRRFAPLARAAKDFFEGRIGAPLSILYRVNAGRVPHGHWTQDARTGGGRIVGEVCHFIDLMQYLTDAPPTRVHAEAVAGRDEQGVEEDSVLITLRFADGSNGAIAYLAEGDNSLPKERVEIFGAGRVFVIDDFRSATSHRNQRAETIKLRRQDKGQAAQMSAVCRMVKEGTPAPIPLAELIATTRATFRILASLRTGQAENV
ncbi:MAG: bi-domain-containing oxidoreductase, partial [Acidobacteriota bacterium]|nr:bi-domain-containing oxidoreductase [Acidobacteriota bacterium]